ncbi:MAG: hypothetical protein GH144_00100 [Clostridia bacterium]|jgi:hypothetical protein|nr:hypothetical protein [Clostridia bacterium]
MEEEKEVLDLGKIDLSQFAKEESKEEPGEERVEEGPGPEEEKEDEYVEVALSTQMLVSLVGMALSMRYLPDKNAVKAFNKKYREDLPKIIEDFGLEEVFEEVLASTLSFKVKKTDVLDIVLPGWVGLAVVLGVLVVAGLIIKVPSKGKVEEHKDIREGKEHGLTKEPRKD